LVELRQLDLTEGYAAVANDELLARESVTVQCTLRAAGTPALTADEKRMFTRRFDHYLFSNIHDIHQQWHKQDEQQHPSSVILK